jgi:energy-converting hydrogenase Eha subunit E
MEVRCCRQNYKVWKFSGWLVMHSTCYGAFVAAEPTLKALNIELSAIGVCPW